MREPVVIKLSEPVQVMDIQVAELTLRPPRGKDLIQIGNPMLMAGGRPAPGAEQSMTVDVNNDVMARLIARLANVPITAVEDLAATDFMQASLAVMGFLSPAESI